ncbi:MAG: PadR family transcriptional regulator [Solidesulfovibrio sp. DCME]|uniref:PadR family transcriptional regulator n=1 Tax=Solidesulfovibrio sp. DCME TaxID=3447380 RepID=UPI003D0C8F83
MSSKHNRLGNERYAQAAILIILFDRNMHGYEIAQNLHGMSLFSGGSEERPGSKSSKIYSHLRKMEDESLLISQWKTEGPNKPRRVYSISCQGKIRLSQLMTEIAFDLSSLFELVERYRMLASQH